MFSLGTGALVLPLPLPIRNGILTGPLNANRSSITNVAAVAFTDGSVMTTAGTSGFTGTITNLASSSVVLTTNTVTAMVVSGAGTVQDNDVYYPSTGFYSHGGWVPFPNSYTNAAGYAVFLRPQLVGPPPGGPWPPGAYVTNPAVWFLNGYKEIVAYHGFGIGTNYLDYGWGTNSASPVGQWDLVLLGDAPAPLLTATNIVSVIPDQISVMCISGYSNGVCTSLRFATNVEAIPWLGDAGCCDANGGSAANGANGSNGTNATITIASTITGAPGTSASVANLGTSTAAVLQFTIPQGATGPAGPTGPTGAVGPAGSNGTSAVPANVITNNQTSVTLGFDTNSLSPGQVTLQTFDATDQRIPGFLIRGGDELNGGSFAGGGNVTLRAGNGMGPGGPTGAGTLTLGGQTNYAGQLGNVLLLGNVEINGWGISQAAIDGEAQIYAVSNCAALSDPLGSAAAATNGLGDLAFCSTINSNQISGHINAGQIDGLPANGANGLNATINVTNLSAIPSTIRLPSGSGFKIFAVTNASCTIGSVIPAPGQYSECELLFTNSGAYTIFVTNRFAFYQSIGGSNTNVVAIPAGGQAGEFINSITGITTNLWTWQ